MIAVGDELLDGRVVDTNSARLAARLRGLGHTLGAIQVVDDSLEAIVDALKIAATRSDHVIVSGGLGATDDDRTREAVARWLGDPLEAREATVALVEQAMKGRSRTMTEAHRKHAFIPRGARALPNPCGLAVGFSARYLKTDVTVLPGVPAEFDAMVDAHLLPALSQGGWTQRTLGFFALSELTLEARLASLKIADSVTVALTAGDGTLGLALSVARSEDGDDLDAAVVAIKGTLGAHLIGEGPDARNPAVLVGERLKEREETLATAESCTGGLIGHLLTEVPGCSAYFLEAVVAYANGAKQRRLWVRGETLETHGAVSTSTALEMVRGLRRRSGATWGVATTGLAGPGGGRPNKPVGLVHIAVEGPEITLHRALYYPGQSRALIKHLTAYGALTLLLAAVEGREPWPQPEIPSEIELD